ncbi:MAG: DegT/DnrJ/EryC1/StrS family aminotransferase [Thermoguttaceae bacterium]
MMQRSTNDSKPVSPRRDFLKSAGALAAGLCMAGTESLAAAPSLAGGSKLETLALNGGPKAVTTPTSSATHWPLYGEAEEKELVALLRAPSYAPIAELEKAWSEFHNTPLCKAHCNGTNALTSMMFALDYPPGTEILVPDYSTWFPVVPMRLFGLVPVWVDINPKTLNIDVEDCKRRLTKNTRAVLAVHWYGLPCDMDQLCDFAKERGLDVLEDCSHAHGATLQGKLTGTWGRMAGFSLQKSKPLPAIEGGMGMYKNRLDYERAVTYGNYELPRSFPEGSPYRKYHGTALGSKLRMHPMAAILAKNQLKHLVERNTAGVAQVKRMNERLTQLPGLSEQYVRPDVKRAFYSANTLMIDSAKAGMTREACAKALAAEGVEVSIDWDNMGVTWPLLHNFVVFHEAKWWHHLPALPDKMPGCDEANRTVMRLPYFTSESPELVDQYCKAFEKVWAHRKDLA